MITTVVSVPPIQDQQFTDWLCLLIQENPIKEQELRTWRQQQADEEIRAYYAKLDRKPNPPIPPDQEGARNTPDGPTPET